MFVSNCPRPRPGGLPSFRSYDFVVAKHGGNVVQAERELLSFALGLRLHHHDHPRLHLLGLFSGVIADISSVGGTSARIKICSKSQSCMVQTGRTQVGGTSAHASAGAAVAKLPETQRPHGARSDYHNEELLLSSSVSLLY